MLLMMKALAVLTLKKQYDVASYPQQDQMKLFVLQTNGCCVVYLHVTLHCQKPRLAVLRTKFVKMT